MHPSTQNNYHSSFTNDTWNILKLPQTKPSSQKTTMLTILCLSSEFAKQATITQAIRILLQGSAKHCQLAHEAACFAIISLHEDNECSRTDFTMVLRRRYNYILHKLLADRADLFGQCGTKHHDLLLVWCHAEYFLHISSHIWK